MISYLPANILRFFVLVLLQILVFNNIYLGGYINPYVYVLFILLMPLETNPYLSLIGGFVIGITLDIFVATPGLHTSASVFLAFARIFILRLMAPREGYEFGAAPTIHSQGISWFATYAGILVFLHHIFLFTVEVFRFSEMAGVIAKSFLSAIVTMLVIILIQYLSYSKRGSNG